MNINNIYYSQTINKFKIILKDSEIRKKVTICYIIYKNFIIFLYEFKISLCNEMFHQLNTINEIKCLL